MSSDFFLFRAYLNSPLANEATNRLAMIQRLRFMSRHCSQNVWISRFTLLRLNGLEHEQETVAFAYTDNEKWRNEETKKQAACLDESNEKRRLYIVQANVILQMKPRHGITAKKLDVNA